jgi:hypothetical protein
VSHCGLHETKRHRLGSWFRFEMRPGETAKDAYERELRAMARNDDHGRKSQEALPDTA